MGYVASATGWSTRSGTNSESAGSAVPVAQWVPDPRSLTQDDTVWLEASRPPACMFGPVIEPLTGDHRGPPSVPLSRRIEIASRTPSAPPARRWVRACREAQPATRPRSRSAYLSAKPGIVSPLLMLRAAVVTSSVAQCRPAVSRTIAPSRSATRKLLW